MVASHHPQAAPLLSVIVPTHGRPGKLHSLLTGLAATPLARHDFEVLYVVDGRDEPPPDVRDALPPSIRCDMLVQDRAGPAAARNVALERARGEWALFLNDDARVTGDTVPAHLDRIRRDPTARTAFLGRFDFEPSLIDSAWRRLLAETSMLFFYNRMQPDERYGYRHFWTCNLAVRTDLVREVGGFCAKLNAETAGIAVHEDIELGYRLQRHCGIEVCYAAEIACGHDHALSPRDYFLREYRAGWGAATAATVNRPFHDEVWPWVTDADGQYEALRAVLAGQLHETIREMQSWTQRPAHDVTRGELRAAYLAHVPLKRACFLLGYARRAFDEIWPDGTAA